MQSLAPILRFVLDERGWPCADRLERLSAQLPAVATAGLEVPLGSEGAIDLQQRVQSEDEIARLARWFARSTPKGAGWQRLAAALDPIAGDVDELWLELDDVEGSDEAPLSVFVRLSDPGAPAIADVLTAFDMQLDPSRQAALARCLAACGSGARLSYLGLMLGRAGAPLRLIIEGVAPQDARALLDRSGWPGPIDSAAEWIDRLFVHADRIRLAMTLADTLTSEIGLECFVGEPAANDPRWRCLFDLLVEDGLCTPARRDQLLDWPAVLTPLSAQHWPEALIADALLRTAPGVRWLDCRISHAKVTLAPEQPPRAKGYFGFIEVQNPPAADLMAQPRMAAGDIATAVNAATDFLVGARNQAGWWLDYDGFSEGPADEWVSAYVAHALHDSDRADARDAAVRGWHLLKARARSGWGWNFLQPADADSTIWGLRLAAALGHSATHEARNATAFLRQHLDANGGIATYRRAIYAHWSGGKAVNPAWYDAHACVTAAAAHVPGLGPGPLAYLRDLQQADGTWRGYWWQSDHYTIGLAAEALAATGRADDADRVQRAAAATRAWLERDGGPESLCERSFDAAWALRTLLLMPMDSWELIARLADQIQRVQRDDGSWAASAALAIPNRQGDIVSAIDNRRCFTTATMLTALGRYERLKPAEH
ncbi:hypothetical protein [Sphingomonas sp.]|jgi:hypothetical protein|uniref:hypothetical protein n=1 Tax=Sphingomonas sp. TaxID=28214 RepID=UPI0017F15D36|nr:hypothetical protein [Sphingomonas sp.]MBA4761174.1 hypothetical protein [Sphingomonas sp.]